jgi:hypothetical protein
MSYCAARPSVGPFVFLGALCAATFAGAGGLDVRPGDLVRIKMGPAPLMDGKKAIAIIDQGTVLKVNSVKGKWLNVTLNVQGKYAIGYLHTSYLKIESRRASAGRDGLALAATDPNDRPDGKEAAEIVERFESARQANPLPSPLQRISLPFGTRVQVQAATVEVVGPLSDMKLRVFVVSKGATIPRRARCVIIGFSDAIDLPATVKMLRGFARGSGGYADMETQDFAIKVLGRWEKGKERVFVFEGPLVSSKSKDARSFFTRLGYWGYVGVQVCTPAPRFESGCKPASNVCWAKATRAEPAAEPKAKATPGKK